MIPGSRAALKTAARTMETVATLKRMSAKTLANKILEERESTNPSYAVVDVRDDDYIGGHIKGGIHAPSRSLDVFMPTLVRKTKDKQLVVFHCMLSQQRGPSAALKYMRERDGVLAALGEKEKEREEQDVYVLDRGFTGWQEGFGEDERLTEGYVKDLWQE